MILRKRWKYTAPYTTQIKSFNGKIKEAKLFINPKVGNIHFIQSINCEDNQYLDGSACVSLFYSILMIRLYALRNAPLALVVQNAILAILQLIGIKMTVLILALLVQTL